MKEENGNYCCGNYKYLTVLLIMKFLSLVKKYISNCQGMPQKVPLNGTCWSREAVKPNWLGDNYEQISVPACNSSNLDVIIGGNN